MKLSVVEFYKRLKCPISFCAAVQGEDELEDSLCAALFRQRSSSSLFSVHPPVTSRVKCSGRWRICSHSQFLRLAVMLCLIQLLEAQITFSSANAISSNSTTTTPYTIAPGDLNHDPFTDVVVCVCQCHGSVSVVLLSRPVCVSVSHSPCVCACARASLCLCVFACACLSVQGYVSLSYSAVWWPACDFVVVVGDSTQLRRNIWSSGVVRWELQHDLPLHARNSVLTLLPVHGRHSV